MATREARPSGVTFDQSSVARSFTTRVAVTPGQVVLQTGGTRQLLVTAHWADGTREDFTRQVRYLSNNPEVVSVGPDGRLTGRRVGETSIQVLAGGQSASATVGVIEEPVAAYPEVPATTSLTTMSSPRPANFTWFPRRSPPTPSFCGVSAWT